MTQKKSDLDDIIGSQSTDGSTLLTRRGLRNLSFSIGMLGLSMLGVSAYVLPRTVITPNMSQEEKYLKDKIKVTFEMTRDVYSPILLLAALGTYVASRRSRKMTKKEATSRYNKVVESNVGFWTKD